MRGTTLNTESKSSGSIGTLASPFCISVMLARAADLAAAATVRSGTLYAARSASTRSS